MSTSGQERNRNGANAKKRPSKRERPSDDFERRVTVGGCENPVQCLPSGEGNFLFETNDPGRIDSFYSPDADRLLRQICRSLGPVDIVRMHGYTWSVEDSDTIYGTISEIGGNKWSLSERLDTSKETTEKRTNADCRAKIVVVYHATEASP